MYASCAILNLQQNELLGYLDIHRTSQLRVIPYAPLKMSISPGKKDNFKRKVVFYFFRAMSVFGGVSLFVFSGDKQALFDISIWE